MEAIHKIEIFGIGMVLVDLVDLEVGLLAFVVDEMACMGYAALALV